MRKVLEEDGILLQVYSLAHLHHWPLSVVRRMSLSEFAGWVAFRDMKRTGETDDG